MRASQLIVQRQVVSACVTPACGKRLWQGRTSARFGEAADRPPGAGAAIASGHGRGTRRWMGSGTMHVRGVEARDRDAWERLFRAYIEFYRACVADEVIEATWQRLVSGAAGDPTGLV